MKMTAQENVPSTQTGAPSVMPLQVRKALVGLEMTDYDLSTLKYLKFLFGQIPVKSVCFLHVLPPGDVFSIFGDESKDKNAVPNEKVLAKITRAIEKIFPADCGTEIKIEVKEGNALEQLLGKAEEAKSDLVVIGQKAGSEHHGILVKNFARQVWSNALVIPEQAKPQLKKILVPVDFSNHSAEALHVALAINKCLKKPAKITVLNIYDMPPNYAAYRISRDKVLRMIKEDRQQAITRFIEEHVHAEDLPFVQWHLLEHDHASIGEYILKFAQKSKHGLVVMGAKGHSRLALLLLGSVTEKVLSLTEDIPVLIVK